MTEDKTPLAVIEWLAKTSAAALVLVTALGLPAVQVQMWRLAIPSATAGAIPDVLTSSFERGMALRAGVVPAIALALLAWAVRELWKYNKKAEQAEIPDENKRLGDVTTVGFAVFYATLGVLALFVAAALHIIGRLVTIYLWRDRLLYLGIVEITATILLVALLRLAHVLTNGERLGPSLRL